MIDKYLEIIDVSNIPEWSKRKIIANAQNDYEFDENKLHKKISEAKKLKTFLAWLKSGMIVMFVIGGYYAIYHKEVTVYEDISLLLITALLFLTVTTKFKDNTKMMMLFAVMSLTAYYIVKIDLFLGLAIAFVIDSNLFSDLKKRFWDSEHQF